MPRIAAVATAVPPYTVTQDEARTFADSYFRPHRDDIDRLLPVFNHAGIDARHLCMPIDWLRTPRSFEEKNALYIEWSTRLAGEVITSCAEKAKVALGDLDQIIFVSTTGLATPSIDSRLLNTLDLSPHIVRTPIWGLGCAGGAAGLALAYRLAKADPHARIMMVAVELCSLTFHGGDFSKSNLIATALFADGAAAILVTGDDFPVTAPTTQPAIVAAQSTTWPDSLDVMGWNFDSVGMQVVFAQSIPQLVREKVRDNIDHFLADQDRSLNEITHLIAHPGGAKVITAYETALALENAAMDPARAVLRQFGNMSSPTVLFVLENVLRHATITEGDYGLLTALGPGFSAENVLLRF
jgi:alkylresorcinol/alkylpyrone synthase